VLFVTGEYPPMVGGVVTTALVVLLVFPVIYCIWRGWGLPRRA